MFIEYVLTVRANRHLPIVFVQTHLDYWEQDAAISARAERWHEEVHNTLVELYNADLRSFYPKSLVERKRIAFRVSSVGKTPDADQKLEQVVDQLVELVAESRSHQRQLRKSGLRTLLPGPRFSPCCYYWSSGGYRIGVA